MVVYYVFVTPRPIECMDRHYIPPEEEQHLIRRLRIFGHEPCVSVKPLPYEEVIDSKGLCLFVHPEYGLELVITTEKGSVKYLFDRGYRVLCLQQYKQPMSRTQLIRLRDESLYFFGMGPKVEKRVTRSSVKEIVPQKLAIIKEPDWTFERGQTIIIDPNNETTVDVEMVD